MVKVGEWRRHKVITLLSLNIINNCSHGNICEKNVELNVKRN